MISISSILLFSSVIFPDLNDLATCGDNLPHAFAMAQEACALYLFSSLKDGEKLPMPTPVNEVELDDNNCFVNLIFVNWMVSPRLLLRPVYS